MVEMAREIFSDIPWIPRPGHRTGKWTADIGHVIHSLYPEINISTPLQKKKPGENRALFPSQGINVKSEVISAAPSFLPADNRQLLSCIYIFLKKDDRHQICIYVYPPEIYHSAMLQPLPQGY